jgi:hypothetical protein
LGGRSGDDVGRCVAQDHWAHAQVVVDQAVAVGIEQEGALGPLEHQGRRGHAEAEIARHAAGEPLRGFGDAPARLFE